MTAPVIGCMLFPCLSRAQYGPNWKSIGSIQSVGYVQCIYFFDTLHGVAAADGIYYTKDGATWIKSITPSGFIFVNEIRCFNGRLYAAVTGPDYLISSDSGVTWSYSGLNVANTTDLYQDGTGAIRALSAPAWQFARVDNLHYIETLDSGTLRVSSNGGALWNVSKPDSIFSDAPWENAYGCYGDTCSKVFLALLVDTLYRSTDFGASWSSVCSTPGNVTFMGGNDLEGAAGEAYSAQAGLSGTERIADYGTNWTNCGSLADAWASSRIFVFGPMGENVVVPTGHELWMTTNGGDGTLGDPVAIPDTLQIQPGTTLGSPCGSTAIPILLQSGVNDLRMKVNITGDSLHEFSITNPASTFILNSSGSDTAWILYTPHSLPSSSTLTLSFQNSWKCSDWAETRTIIVTSPPSAFAIAPAPLNGGCKIVSDSGFISIDSCQSLVITSVQVAPSIANRLQFQYSLPDTIRNGYHNTLPFTFDPRDTAANGTVPIELTGYYFGTSVRFDTTFNVYVAAIPGLPNLTSSLSSVAFGPVKMCANFAARDTSIVFTNSGCAPDTITQITVTGMGFTGGNNTLPIIVQPGDSVTFKYRFVPPDSGAFTGEARLNVSSMGLSENPVVKLNGKAVQGYGVLDVRSTSLQSGSFSFCAGDTTVFDTISNKGCDTLVISNIVFTGDAAFSLTSPLHDTLLLPYDSAIIQFYFAPRTKGAHAATLSFHSQNIVNDSGHNTTITLAGIGIADRVALALPVTTLALPQVIAGCGADTAAISFTNAGCKSITIDSVVGLSAPFSSSPVSNQQLDTGHTATFKIYYAPIVAELKSGVARIYYRGADSTEHDTTIAISAAAIEPPSVSVYLKPGQLSDTNQGLVSIPVYASSASSVAEIGSIALRLDMRTDLLTPESITSPIAGAGTAPLQMDANGASITLTLPGNFSISSDTLITTVACRVYVTDTTKTAISLTSASSSGAANCLSLTSVGVQSFTLIPSCGDPTLTETLAHGSVPFSILSIIPNPASGEITVVVAAAGDLHAVEYEMFDALGREQDVRSTSLRLGVALDVTKVPSGIYFLRVSEGGYVESRSVVIER